MPGLILFGFVLFSFSYRASTIGISDDCKVMVQQQLQAWSKVPENFPVRVQGDRNLDIPDIIIWDPLTTTTLALLCPNCNLALRPTRWKDGKSAHDQPRKLFCIQRSGILASRVYRCPNNHQTLAHDSEILHLFSGKIHTPFVLFHKYGVTYDLSQCILSHIYAGLKIADIERLLK